VRCNVSLTRYLDRMSRAKSSKIVGRRRTGLGWQGQDCRGLLLTAELRWSRAIAGALVFSKDAPDLLWVWRGALCRQRRCSQAQPLPVQAARTWFEGSTAAPGLGARLSDRLRDGWLAKT